VPLSWPWIMACKKDASRLPSEGAVGESVCNQATKPERRFHNAAARAANVRASARF